MEDIDFKKFIAAEQPAKLIVLHHWDTDGLACAALFLDYLTKVSPDTEVQLMHPTINNYFLVDGEYEDIADFDVDALLTTDINFPLEVIEKLESIVPNVFVFDHHSQTADINRPGVQDTKYPGCTMLVNEYLENNLSLTAVLGMVGDQEDKIKDEPEFYVQVETVMAKQDLKFEDVLRITKLLDTSYIVGSEESLLHAIQIICDDPKAALTDEELLGNEKQIKLELDQELAKELEDKADGIFYSSVKSQLSLISEVTRAFAKDNPDSIIVTDQIRPDGSSLYVRRRNAGIDLGVIVEAAREQGLNAGGKPEVAGVVLPTEKLDDFREQVFKILKDNVK